MKRTHAYLILMYFTCTWVIVGFLVWHYANHDHPTIIVEREKVCDCADELRDVSADLAVYKGMAQDMHAIGQKMFNGLRLIQDWIEADREHEEEQAELIQKAQKTADEALKKSRQYQCR